MMDDTTKLSLTPTSSSPQVRVVLVVIVGTCMITGLLFSETFVKNTRYFNNTTFNGRQVSNNAHILQTLNWNNSKPILLRDVDTGKARPLLGPSDSRRGLPPLLAPPSSISPILSSASALFLANAINGQLTHAITPTLSSTVCTNPDDFTYHACDNETEAPSSNIERLFVVKVDASQGFGCQVLFLIQVAAFAQSLGVTPYIALTSSRAYRSTNTSHTHNLTHPPRTREWYWFLHSILLYSFVHCGFQSLADVRIAQHQLACRDTTIVTMRADRWMRARLTMIKLATNRLSLNTQQQKRFPMRGATTRKHANEIFSNFLKVHPSVEERARTFWNSQFRNQSCVIGVHYRGKDKVEGEWAESTRFPIATITTLVYNVSRVEGCTQIFVASDEPRFFNEFTQTMREQTRFNNNNNNNKNYGVSLHIVAAPLKHACMNNCSSLHYGVNEDNFLQIREATTTMLLLSWCKHLVKTPSLFSAVSAIMNPDLHVTLTHHPQKYFQFPENQMQLTSEFLAASPS